MSQEGLRTLQEKLKGAGSGHKKLDDADSFVWVHHLLMKEYGWMSAEEFGNIPMPALWNMLECIQKDREAEQRENNKAKNKRK